MKSLLEKQKERLSLDIVALQKQLDKTHSQANPCAVYQIESDLVGLKKEYNALALYTRIGYHP